MASMMRDALLHRLHDLRVGVQVDVALAVAGLGVGQAVVLAGGQGEGLGLEEEAVGRGRYQTLRFAQRRRGSAWAQTVSSPVLVLPSAPRTATTRSL